MSQSQGTAATAKWSAFRVLPGRALSGNMCEDRELSHEQGQKFWVCEAVLAIPNIELVHHRRSYAQENYEVADEVEGQQPQHYPPNTKTKQLAHTTKGLLENWAWSIASISRQHHASTRV
eukprot:328632-Amphidinium_carterae.3